MFIGWRGSVFSGKKTAQALGVLLLQGMFIPSTIKKQNLQNTIAHLNGNLFNRPVSPTFLSGLVELCMFRITDQCTAAVENLTDLLEPEVCESSEVNDAKVQPDYRIVDTPNPLQYFQNVFIPNQGSKSVQFKAFAFAFK